MSRRVGVAGAALTATLLAISLFLTAESAQAAWHNDRLDELASWLARRPVKVRCLTVAESNEDFVIGFQGASAYVDGRLDERGRWHPRDQTVFKVGICERLSNLFDAHLGTDVSQWSARSVAWAIHVLTHEAGHLRGAPWSGSEARTECWAIQHVQAVGRRLGIQALWLLQYLVNEQYASMPAEYRLTGCVLPAAEAPAEPIGAV